MTPRGGIPLTVATGVVLAGAPSAAYASGSGTTAAPPAAAAALTVVAVVASLLSAGLALVGTRRRSAVPDGESPDMLMLQRFSAVAAGTALLLIAAMTGRWSPVVVLLAIVAAVPVAGRRVPRRHRLAAAITTAVLLPPAVALLHTRPGPAVWLAVAAAEPLGAAAVVAAGVIATMLTAAGQAGDRARLRRRLSAGAVLLVAGAAGSIAVGLSHGSVRSPIGGAVPAAAITVAAAVAAVVSVALVRRRPAVPAAVILVAVLAAAGLLVDRAAAPELPTLPGTPVLRRLDALPGAPALLVAPGRPGLNVVHLAAAGAQVGERPDALAPTAARPGAGPGWAEIRLAPGRNRIWLRAGGAVTSLDVDAGPAAVSPTRAADLPECAATVLGSLLAARPPQWPGCPADRLDAADVRALHATVDFLAGRDVTAIALVDDGSPRGRQAAAAVRARARAAGVRLTDPGAGRVPLLVVSGWSAADAAVRRVAAGTLPAEGVYLAPWLLVSALLEAPAGQVTGVDFDPGGPVAHAYLTALHAAFPGDSACTGGFRSFSGADPRHPGDPVRMFASSRIVMPGMTGHSGHAGTRRWLPDGAVTAVTGPLG